MADRTLDELGPVDYLIVEFPEGQQNFAGEGADELVKLHDAGIIRIMDMLILEKAADGSVDAHELCDIAELGELQRIEARAGADPGRGGRGASRRRHGPGERRGRAGLENFGRHRSRRPCAVRVASSSPTAGSRSRPSSPPSRPTRHPQQKEPDMPLGPGRAGRGVIGAPVAKAAVVTAAVKPGPSPVAKAAG